MEIRIHKRQNTVLEFFCKVNTGKTWQQTHKQTHTSRQQIFFLANATSKTVFHNKLRDDGMAQDYSEAFKPVV